MSAKTFFFWTGVGIVTLAGSFLLIRWIIKNEERQSAEQRKKEVQQYTATRREAGFHAIAKDHANAMA
jgi:hypothetical protein